MPFLSLKDFLLSISILQEEATKLEPNPWGTMAQSKLHVLQWGPGDIATYPHQYSVLLDAETHGT